MRKYIHIAKSIKPTLSKEACEVVAEEYSRLRSQDVEHADIARVSYIDSVQLGLFSCFFTQLIFPSCMKRSLYFPFHSDTLLTREGKIVCGEAL